MEGLSSLEVVRSELLRRRLPRGYVRRIMDELTDHHEDIAGGGEAGGRGETRDVMAAARRLGDPVMLADFVATQYRTRTIAGRHPFLAFVVAPIPLAVAVWIVFATMGFGLLWAVGGMVGHRDGQTLAEMSPVFVACVWSLHYASTIVPWAVATALLCWLGRRSGRGLSWVLAGSAALVAVLAMSFHTSLKMPTVPHGGQYSVGLGFGWNLLWSWHSLQAMAPLAVAGAFLLLSRQDSDTALADH